MQVEIRDQFRDPLWRMSNLYWMLDDNGVPFRFTPNDAQIELYQGAHSMNVILKSRQWGFTTFIDLWALDSVLWNPGYVAAIIAHKIEDAKKIFKRKVVYPYEQLPEGLRNAIPVQAWRADALEMGNDSEISVTTSGRSGTLQFLHVSEMGKIAMQRPDVAEEIVTGSFPALNINAVENGRDRARKLCFVESTAEGRGGEFYRIVSEARRDAERQKILNPKEFKFFFFPWFGKKSNRMDSEHVEISAEVAEYLDKIQDAAGIRLEPEQRAWYAAEMKRLGDWPRMKQENPSNADEPFEVAIVGAYYGDILARMRMAGKIGRFPHVESELVHTFWDLGKNDVTAVWFMQWIGRRARFVHYYETHGLQDMAEHMEETRIKRKFRFGTLWLPHDGDYQTSVEISPREMLDGLGYRDIEIVDRVPDLVRMGIPAVRRFLPECEIDSEGCAAGLMALENYKRKWDERNACWRDQPQHNHASNGADAFRQAAQAHERLYVKFDKPESSKKRKAAAQRSWKVA